MSAQLQSQNHFTAFLALAAGVTVNVNAPNLETLAVTVAKLQGTAANDTSLPPAVAPSPAPVSTAKADVKGEAGKAPASTPAPASAPAAAGGSASEGDAKRPTYDDVKDRVLKLAKVSRATATAALAEYGVDHGNKLKLEQYPAFIAHADQLLAAKAA